MSLYRRLREYDLSVAYGSLNADLQAMNRSEDSLFREFGRQTRTTSLRKALREGTLSDLLENTPVFETHEAQVFYNKELEVLLGQNTPDEPHTERARYIDERIRAHPTRKPSLVKQLFVR